MLAFKVDLKAYRKAMDETHRRQLPFATAQALTATAGHVGLAWQQEMQTKLDKPTPFTVNSVAVTPARKDNRTAVVYIRDIAAQYLEPFVDGGTHFLGGKQGLLTPKDIKTNAYGNIPRNALSALKGRPDIFIGKVETKDGQSINGVWQRVNVNTKGGVRRGKKANRGSLYSAQHGRLKLLIRFNDPMVVRQHLDFDGRAAEAVAKYIEPEFAKAFSKAMATAR